MSKTARKQPKRLVAALAAGLGLLGFESGALASVLSVTSCADDGSSGTLRDVAAQALHGDTIDLGGLSCVGSTVTLTQGEIVLPYNVTVSGPSAGGLTIKAVGSRIFNSTTQDKPAPYLTIQNLALSSGSVDTGADDAAGGCVLAAGLLTLSNSSVSDCSATSASGSARGGGIYAQSVQLISSRVTTNNANAPSHGPIARGGGIYAFDQVYCKDSTISGNGALAESESNNGYGGGVLLSGGDLTLYRCTVDGNVADNGAGVAQFVFGGATQVTLVENSTISGNAGTGQYSAAGLNVFCLDCGPAAVQIYNSTIAFNTTHSTYIGGVSTNGAIVAQSTIIANNTGLGGVAADTFAHRLSGADNLVMASNVADPGSVVSSADPQLVPLADNGGPTRTHALAATSPALGAGNDTMGFATDQRGAGFLRMVANAVDIGAFQSQGATRPAAGDTIFSATFNN